MEYLYINDSMCGIQYKDKNVIIKLFCGMILSIENRRMYTIDYMDFNNGIAFYNYYEYFEEDVPQKYHQLIRDMKDNLDVILALDGKWRV